MENPSSPSPKRPSSLSISQGSFPAQNQNHKMGSRASTDPSSSSDRSHIHTHTRTGSRNPFHHNNHHHTLHLHHKSHHEDGGAPKNHEDEDNDKGNDNNDDKDSAAQNNNNNNNNQRRRSHRHLKIDTSVLDRGRSKSPRGFKHGHIHSKSHEGRLQRSMNGGKTLLPAWSSSSNKEKDRDGRAGTGVEVDGLLAPGTREMSRTRWDSMSTSGSRKASLISESDLSARAGPFRKQEIRSLEELERVKKRRKQGEQFLRTSLGSVGTLATDITRRLDYTYYNLLERIGDFNSTVASFQELSDSTSTLVDEFDRENTELEHEVRKHLDEIKGLEPQVQKIAALEERMKKGKERAEMLGGRLQSAGNAVHDWERRDDQLQKRSSRRLRVFWAVAGTSILVLVIAMAMRKW